MRQRVVETFLYIVFRIYWRIIRSKYYSNPNEAKKPRIIFGSTPIINNKYWSRSLVESGYNSVSLSHGLPVINKKEDFDLYLDELFPIIGDITSYKILLRQLKLITYVVKNYDIVVSSFRFTLLEGTRFWEKEAYILKYFGKKTIVIPYGSDYYMYSKLIDNSLKHNLFVNVYQEIFNEEYIDKRVKYWKNQADFMVIAIMLDGAPRWDALPVNMLCIDTQEWSPNINRSHINDGVNGVVKIAHSPNHRGFKGTEYILDAVNQLQNEGLKVELILIEGKQNTEVKRILHEEADILIEQIIFTGYALSGIEGMASGLPVMSNLESDFITEVFRRYSYLNECPIVSTSPENIVENLRFLVKNPEIRREIGIASRAFAEKYHSYNSSQYLFDKIIDKIWYNKEVNTFNLFHPLFSDSFNNLSPIIKSPLKKNKLPIKN